MTLSGFHGLERFRVGKIPVVLPEAGTEFTESPEVSWPQTSLHGLAGQRWAGVHDPGRPRTQVMSLLPSMGSVNVGESLAPSSAKNGG